MQQLSRQAQSETPSGRQEELAAKVDALEKKLAGLQKKLGDRDSTSREEDEKLRKKVGAAREALRRARNAMKQASRKMEGGQSASSEQASAEASLNEARESLSGSEEDALERLKRKEEELAGIRKEQDELERLTRKVSQEDEEGGESLSSAAGSMREASDSLGQGQTSRARQQQEEALEQLEQEESRLQEEEMELADLKTEQDLIDLIATITEMSDSMEVIIKATVAISGELGDRRANRSQKARLRGLSRRVAAVDELGQDVHRRLEEEEARVFTYIMEDLLEDLAEVKESLQPRYDPGEVTQMLEQEVVDGLQRLRSSLEEELRRRMQQQQQGQPPPGGGRPRMVPPAAELIALKRMQEEVLERTRRIDSIRKRNNGELDTLEEQLLERLVQRQGSIIQLTDQIAEDLGEQLQPTVEEEVREDGPPPPDDGEG
ncbi:MAG TPA: hypothetical protein EYN79_02815 [Planctomycetes bacterium]|nr:hypothetical protein [Planctomycetota bacterium]HIN80971.1 hypothetical protein [Planctomycetota bacterium]